MKDTTAQLLHARKRLAGQFPDASPVLTGCLLSRMVRCNKPGCRYCEKGKGKGHGPIWILAVRQELGRVRQITIPADLKKEVEEGLRRFQGIQKLLKQIARINQALLEERKRDSRVS